MAGGISRNQGKDLASQSIFRQDSGGFITDGGGFSWDVVPDELSWSSPIRVRRAGGVGSATIAVGSIGGMSAEGDCAYIVLNRAVAGGPYTVLTAAIGSSAVNDDGVLVLGVRGADDRFYMRDGTIIGSGETKALGQVNTATDRTEVVSDGRLTGNPYLTGFDYALGTNQLAVFVGGILQVEGTHYNEDAGSPGAVDFISGFEPTASELITFVNIVGGEGVVIGGGTPIFQDVYDAGSRTIVLPTSGKRDLEFYGDTPVAEAQTFLSSSHGPGDTGGIALKLNGNASFGQQVQINYNRGVREPWQILADDSDESLVLYNTVSGDGIRLGRNGGISHGNMGTFPTFDDDVALKWTEYAGTFSNGGPTVVNTGLTAAAIKGVLLKAYNAVTGLDVFMEISLGSGTNRNIYVSHDPTSPGDIIMSGNSSGTAAVGSNFTDEAYTLIVFHE